MSRIFLLINFFVFSNLTFPPVYFLFASMPGSMKSRLEMKAPKVLWTEAAVSMGISSAKTISRARCNHTGWMLQRIVSRLACRPAYYRSFLKEQNMAVYK